MENDQKQRNKKEKEIKVAQEEVEDATEYGEFVCSYFAWKTLEEQKEKAKKLLEEIADNSFEYLKWYTTLTPNQLRSIDRDVQINQFILIKNVIPMFISQNDQESAMKYVNKLKSIGIDTTAMLQQQ